VKTYYSIIKYSTETHKRTYVLINFTVYKYVFLMNMVLAAGNFSPWLRLRRS